LQKCLAGSHDNFVGGAEGDERMVSNNTSSIGYL